MDGYLISLATFTAINVGLALSLNLISGFCGQISLGHAAFFGTGAYASALLSVNGSPFVLSLLAGGLAAAILGLIVGLASLRVREDFLAITTMGVSFLFIGFVRKQEWLGGEVGISSIPKPLSDEGMAILAFALAAAIGLLLWQIRRSWMGRIFDMIAQDEDAALSLGIDTARYKLAAFVLGTAAAGLMGVVYAHLVQLIVPDAFDFIVSVTILAMVVVGGVGSIWGVVAGALLLTLLPEMVRFVNDYKLLIYGSLMIAVMLASPGGLAGVAAKLLKRGG